MQTLLLDRSTWDLVLDVNGDVAVASDPYSLAQDAASAVKLFLGELWFDTTQGVPYFGQILGQAPNFTFIKQRMVDAALTVPGVVAARVFFSSFEGRLLKGQVQVTDRAGVITSAGF